MEVEKILHMKEGVGQISYANNSHIQRTVMTKTKPILEESIREVYDALKPKCFIMADMGCSSGQNVMHLVSEIINVVDTTCRSLTIQSPQFGVYLNDLSGNDFNNLFNFFPEFYKWLEQEKGSDFGPCFISATPRSFYGRVLPDDFLHFVHSCYSLHWLSQVPPGLVTEEGVGLNKGNICIATTSPPEVQKAYYMQFKRDFILFLRSRARELVPEGRMVLTFLARNHSTEPDLLHGMLGSSLHDMVLQGIIEEEKLDKYNLPMYSPSVEEVRQLVEAEGSFVLNKLESFTVDWSIIDDDKTQNMDNQAMFVAKNIRAVMESLLANAFGERFMDELFLRFQTKLKECMATQMGQYLNVVVSMTKKSMNC